MSCIRAHYGLPCATHEYAGYETAHGDNWEMWDYLQAEDDDVLSISSRLRDVMIGSEDEMESVMSGPLSDDGHEDALGGSRRHTST